MEPRVPAKGRSEHKPMDEFDASETLIGAFPDVYSAERAAETALSLGVPPSAISLVVRMRPSAPEADYQSQPTLVSGPAGAQRRFDPLGNDIRNSTPIPVQGGNEWPIGENAEIDGAQPNGADHPIAPSELESEEQGARTASIGIGVGSLAALAATAIPGVGLAIGGGILATSLIATTAMVTHDAHLDGIDRYLDDRHVPVDEIRGFRDSFDRGGAILSVEMPTGERSDRLAHALREHQAERVGRYRG